MNVSVLGAGAWGITIAQTLTDNGHNVAIYDVNKEFVDSINNGSHPFFKDNKIENIKGFYTLKEALDFAPYIVICVPTKFTRGLLKEVNTLLTDKKVFINVSKGIEPDTSKCVREIVDDEIDKKFIRGYASLSGPSHAEELIQRKLTLLVSASMDKEIAKEVQLLFANGTYLRVYTSTDVIGCEIGGAIKNAIAVVSGVLTGLGLGENARAALISRGILEIERVVVAMGGKKETAFGLTGMGDLIVTASSLNSRNFNAGIAIGRGESAADAVKNSKQTVEGVRAVLAAYQIGKKFNIELPIINAAYSVLYENIDPVIAIRGVLSRELKAE
jgi:glycerol-3-phosphate dehydrogenase (NAD(P)+)